MVDAARCSQRPRIMLSNHRDGFSAVQVQSGTEGTSRRRTFMRKYGKWLLVLGVLAASPVSGQCGWFPWRPVTDAVFWCRPERTESGSGRSDYRSHEGCGDSGFRRERRSPEWRRHSGGQSLSRPATEHWLSVWRSQCPASKVSKTIFASYRMLAARCSLHLIPAIRSCPTRESLRPGSTNSGSADQEFVR